MPKRLREGDILAVPLAEELIAVGIVLHISRYFANLMMVGYYGQVFESINAIDIDKLEGEFIETPSYTTRQVVTKGRWQVVGHAPHLLEQAVIPDLRVAYQVFHKDEIIRHLTPLELNNYSSLKVPGVFLLEDQLRKRLLGLSQEDMDTRTDPY